MAFMAMSAPPDDGTPPAVRATVETIDELAAALRTLPGATEARVVDDTHPEYGEGLQRRRVRGQDREFAEPQLFLGGRPLNDDEQAGLDAALADFDQAIERFGLEGRLR